MNQQKCTSKQTKQNFIDVDSKINFLQQKQTRLVNTSFKIAVRTGFIARLVKHCKIVFMATLFILVGMVIMVNTKKHVV
jgi:hypothetical protein